MSAGLVSLNMVSISREERMAKYQAFAVAFAYPSARLVEFFPQATGEVEALAHEYDRVFRFCEVWLYGAEHMSENEFQRVQHLADISGFYKAFGVESDKERPDILTCELEFMHYLIFKELRAETFSLQEEASAKASLCLEAQKKFFEAHLYPAARKIAEKVLGEGDRIHEFYREAAAGLQEFLESEKDFFAGARV